MFDRTGIVNRPSVARNWMLLNGTHCMVTWAPLASGACLQCHHIVGGSARSDEACNFLCVSSETHGVYHGSRIADNGTYWRKLTMGMILLVKKRATSDEWDAERLEALLGESLPPLEELPEFYQQQRSRWRGNASEYVVE